MRIVFDEWINDIPSQFREKKNIEILIKAFSRQLQEVQQMFADLYEKTDLDVAAGQNLDYVGTIIPLTRKEAGELAGLNVEEPVMSDARYRQFLRYRLLRNTSSCTYYDIMMSLDILWRADNIRYVEDPKRPATILIRLQYTDLDSETDPAEGKVPALKPAGVTLAYTINYTAVFDQSDLERYLARIRVHITIPYWVCRLFDGLWKPDGAYLLDAQRNYDARLGMKFSGWAFRTRTIEQAASRGVMVKLCVHVAERIRSPTLALHFCLDFRGSAYLDGAENLNGEILLNASRLRVIAAVKQALKVVTKEEIRKAEITKRKNLWFLDASLDLDGANILNAEIVTEEI